MATAEPAPRSSDRHTKIRPFAWMRRLANLKGSSSSDGNGGLGRKMNGLAPSKSKKSTFKRKEPYPSSKADANERATPQISTVGGDQYTQRDSFENPNFTHYSLNDETHDDPSNSRSAAATLDTNAETIHSEGSHSKTGTTNTYGGGKSSMSGGGNSIFSSSNHSSRSLTTTLTTIQSNGPAGLLQGQGGTQTMGNGQIQQANNTSPQSAYFSHQYPTAPASAVPAHLQPTQAHVPTTYRSAIANNLLTDNASIITLASSTNRRHRRNSLDTNASVRAIPPSSVWGGSRESLPLSVLSQTAESTPPQTGGQASTSSGGGLYQTTSQRPSIGPSVERASVYSSSGVAAPVLTSERNSIYAGKSGVGTQGDGASSIRSGLPGHGRNDSTAGSIGGLGGSGSIASGVGMTPTSPRETVGSSIGGGQSRMSRRSEDWKEGLEREGSDEEDGDSDGARISDYRD